MKKIEEEKKFQDLEEKRKILSSVSFVLLQIIFFGLLRSSGYFERKQADIAKSIRNTHEKPNGGMRRMKKKKTITKDMSMTQEKEKV